MLTAIRTFTIVFFLVWSGNVLSAQFDKPIRSKYTPPMIFCPGSNEVRHHHSPATKISRNKKSETQIRVTFNGGIPQVARRAFEDGVVGIIQEWFDTPIPINIQLNWEQLSEGPLAGALPGANYSSFPNAPFPQHVYPVALAEKISRFNLNSLDDPDVVITVNSTIDWYYDFNNPSGIGSKFDFVSILLHEVMHGLGFTAAVGLNEETPPVGFIGVWNNNAISIFTDFIFNSSGNKLTSFPDGTTTMATALQGNNLFFNLISKEDRAKLYAPSIFDGGSSISHLDEQTFNNTNSALMTPFFNRGEVERSAGVALDIMYDMGWDMTYLLHNPLPGNEELDQPVRLQMQLISDSQIDSSSLKIHYSRDNFAREDIAADLRFNSTTGLYEFDLPAPNAEVTYSYYFTVKNRRNIKFTNPGSAPNNKFTFVYGLDNIRPIISHDRINKINTDISQLDILAEITDVFTGVLSAQVNWTLDGVEQAPVMMERQTGFQVTDTTDNYKAILVFPNGPLAEGTSFRYQIVAVDRAKSANTSRLPFAGFFNVTVEAVKEAVVSYVNDFNASTTDFEGNGFRITRPALFNDNAIHSDHPYPEAGQGNFRNLTYELQIPIIIREKDPLMEFDEIVLVEPGEPGTRFGDDEFWDYVIVEGKLLGTNEWLPFIDGYDSDAVPAWRTAYNNSAGGSPTLFRKRVINMVSRGNFKVDDIVFIRFRLFSDPFVNGWGWAIDNLKIQDVSTSVEDFIVENRFNIYPNPNNGSALNIDIDLKQSSTDLLIEIIDLYGRLVKKERIIGAANILRYNTDISELNNGLYLVNVKFVTGDQISKKLIIQR